MEEIAGGWWGLGNLGLGDGDDGVWFRLLDPVGHVGTLNFAAELDKSQ